MYKIAVIGTGYVGLTTGIGLANFGCKVYCLDINNEKIDTLNKGVMPFYEPGMQELLSANIQNKRLRFSAEIEIGIRWADIIFIAVGTPQGQDGKADLTAIFNVAELIGNNVNTNKIIVVKSTVPVGTNHEIEKIINSINKTENHIDIVSNPEFLREGRALYDFLHPDRVVVGTESEHAKEIIKKIYRPLYLNEVPFIFTSIKTAELIKYSANCFLALKIGYINELARLCDSVGADVQAIAYAMGKDGRIGSKFLHPGPGYGGSCFPKDTEALAYVAKEVGSPLSIIETLIQSNNTQKLYAIGKIKKAFGCLEGLTIGILGLSFKSETDDIRESPSLVIIEELLNAGCIIKVYDPQAMENAKNVWKDRIVYCDDEYETATGADGIVIVTEWNQFRNLNLINISAMMKGKYFFDLRNIYKRHEVEEVGLIYTGIGK